jgi:uncharacterized protein (DUF488 family)
MVEPGADVEGTLRRVEGTLRRKDEGTPTSGWSAPTLVRTMSVRKNGRPAPKVFTVGYEGRDPTELVALLCYHEVQVLIDVRLNAISRRRGFSKTALSQALADAGIAYVHERGLGNPKENRAAYRLGHEAAHRRYARHLESQGAEAVSRVSDLVRTAPTALLCVEREPECCHRTAVATSLGASVVSL